MPSRHNDPTLVALTFDFWGTLYQNAYARGDRLQLVAEALECHGQSRPWEVLDAAYGHARSVWDTVWREEQRSISITRWVEEVLAHLEADLTPDAAAELGRKIEEVYLRTDQPRPVEGVQEVVPKLAQEYRLGLISDTGLTPGRVLRRLMDRDGLLRHFDALTFSDELGAAKPRAEPFLHTLDQLEAQPEEAAHIGDLPETDIEGARRVGMKAILFLAVSERYDGRERAHGAFDNYRDLEGVLERLE